MRDVLRWLEHHSVSADQRWKHLPGRNRHWEIERTDEPSHTDRAPITHRPLVPKLARHGLTKKSSSLARGVVSRIDPFLHIAASLGERLAHLPRHRVGYLFLASGHDIADSPQH